MRCIDDGFGSLGFGIGNWCVDNRVDSEEEHLMASSLIVRS
jgi:hypothetical protein